MAFAPPQHKKKRKKSTAASRTAAHERRARGPQERRWPSHPADRSAPRNLEDRGHGEHWRPAPVLLRTGSARGGLTIGAPNDAFEHEAERVADAVMRSSPMPADAHHRARGALAAAPASVTTDPAAASTATVQRAGDAAHDAVVEAQVDRSTASPLQRRCTECERELADAPSRPAPRGGEHLLQRVCESCQEEVGDVVQRAVVSAPRGSGPRVAPTLADALAGARARGGRPLAEGPRNLLEPRFGRSFEQVRIHADASAAQLADHVSAKAFTVGRDVFFGPGQYRPETPGGLRLLAHELVHTVQQEGGGRVQRVTAQELVDHHGGTGAVDVTALASGMGRLVRGSQYRVVHLALRALGDSERDEVAEALVVEHLSEETLRAAARDAGGRNLLVALRRVFGHRYLRPDADETLRWVLQETTLTPQAALPAVDVPAMGIGQTLDINGSSPSHRRPTPARQTPVYDVAAIEALRATHPGAAQAVEQLDFLYGDVDSWVERSGVLSQVSAGWLELAEDYRDRVRSARRARRRMASSGFAPEHSVRWLRRVEATLATLSRVQRAVGPESESANELRQHREELAVVHTATRRAMAGIVEPVHQAEAQALERDEVRDAVAYLRVEARRPRVGSASLRAHAVATHLVRRRSLTNAQVVAALAELRATDRGAFETILFEGRLVAYLLTAFSYSGFDSFRARDEGFISGWIRAEQENLAANRPQGEAFDDEDKLSALGGFLVGLPGGVLDALREALSGIASVFTEEFWSALGELPAMVVDFMSTPSTRYRIGRMVGEATAAEERELREAAPFDFGRQVGAYVGRVVAEVVLSILALGWVVRAVRGTRYGGRLAQMVGALADDAARGPRVNRALNRLSEMAGAARVRHARVRHRLHELWARAPEAAQVFPNWRLQAAAFDPADLDRALARIAEESRRGRWTDEGVAAARAGVQARAAEHAYETAVRRGDAVAVDRALDELEVAMVAFEQAVNRLPSQGALRGAGRVVAAERLADEGLPTVDEAPPGSAPVVRFDRGPSSEIPVDTVSNPRPRTSRESRDEAPNVAGPTPPFDGPRRPQATEHSPVEAEGAPGRNLAVRDPSSRAVEVPGRVLSVAPADLGHLGRHRVVLTQFDGHTQVWVCTHCQRLLARVQIAIDVLDPSTSSIEMRRLQRRLSALRERVLDVELRLSRGDITIDTLPSHVNQIGAHLRDMSHSHPNVVELFAFRTLPMSAGFRSFLRATRRPGNHIAASLYGPMKRKHVRGNSNLQRRTNSMNGGDGQYLRELGDGTPVTDLVIEAWEQRAIEMARQGHGRVDPRGSSTYHCYVDLGFDIGYADGILTSVMRVEWTGLGDVHSHPRPVDNLRG